MEFEKVFREIFVDPASVRELVERMRNPALGGSSRPDVGFDDAGVLERLPSNPPPMHDVIQLRQPRVRLRQGSI